MTVSLKQKGDPLYRRADDPGYRVGWKEKYKFSKGHLEGEMTYGEAKAKAEELQAREKGDRIYFPELILYES